MYLKIVFLTLCSALNVVFTEVIKDLACEQDSLEMTCPDDYVIDVRNALYGKRNILYCYFYSKVTDCSANSALGIVKSQCNRRQTCTIFADNRIFGDPCAGVFKYLEVSYECRKADIKTRYACEDEEIHLRCPDESYLYIANALYGRTNPEVCSVFSDKNVVSNKCKANNALITVASKCDNFRECKIKANNDVFGDPCVGTFKYLQVDYQCLYRDD